MHGSEAVAVFYVLCRDQLTVQARVWQESYFHRRCRGMRVSLAIPCTSTPTPPGRGECSTWRISLSGLSIEVRKSACGYWMQYVANNLSALFLDMGLGTALMRECAKVGGLTYACISCTYCY